MTIITTTVLPPPIAQYFSVDLLKKPTQKFNQDSSELKAMFEFVIKKYGHKADYHPARLERLKKLQQEFMELYERSAKKEEELKAKTKNAVPDIFTLCGSMIKGMQKYCLDLESGQAEQGSIPRNSGKTLRMMRFNRERLPPGSDGLN